MSKNFVKLNRGEKTDWLQENYPNAYLLLTYIARLARRVPNHPDGLPLGSAILGKPKKAGLSRQKYRTALKVLENLGYIVILHNGKEFLENAEKFLETQKSTIKITITSTLVCLLNSDICDINIEEDNQPINQSPTNEQPTSNHKQECKEEKKVKRRKEKYIKENFASDEIFKFKEIVWMPKKEYEQLVTDLGKDIANEYIERMHEYCDSSGKRYEKYSSTARAWHRKDIKEGKINGTPHRRFNQPSTEDKPAGEPHFKPRYAIKPKQGD